MILNFKNIVEFMKDLKWTKMMTGGLKWKTKCWLSILFQGFWSCTSVASIVFVASISQPSKLQIDN